MQKRGLVFGILGVGVIGFILFSCSQEENKQYQSSTQLLSSTLSQKRGVRIRRLFYMAQRACSATVCKTPTNIKGRVYAGGLMVGGSSPNSPGYMITMVGSEEARQRPDLGMGGEETFDLKNTTTLSGGYSCCGGSTYPSDSEAMVSRLEFLFDYVDTEVTFDGSEGAGIANGTYVIRQVFAKEATVTDVGTAGTQVTLQQGDVLLKKPNASVFTFCNDTDNGTDTCSEVTRPANPVQSSAIIQAGSEAQTQMGNTNYAVFSIQLSNNAMSFTKAEAEQGNWLFKVDFDVTDAATFNTAWSNITTEEKLVESFALSFSPGSSGSVTVNLTKEQMSSQ